MKNILRQVHASKRAEADLGIPVPDPETKEVTLAEEVHVDPGGIV